LIEKYGEQPWILQAMEVVRGGIENAIRQLRGPAPAGNMNTFAGGAQYQHPPRSAEEIKADMAERRRTQPDQFAQAFEEEAEEHDDLFARLSRTIGLEPEEVPVETTDERHSGGEMPWVF
jgi:hypothetical protein